MGTYEGAALVAHAMGTADGTAAGSWYFDGNTDSATYAAVLAGLDDGDPEILDTLPCSPLSGEWAGAPLPGDILAAVAAESGHTISDDERDEILTTYEDAYETAAAYEVERVARYQLTD